MLWWWVREVVNDRDAVVRKRTGEVAVGRGDVAPDSGGRMLS
jgi:hypothetical protein